MNRTFCCNIPKAFKNYRNLFITAHQSLHLTGSTSLNLKSVSFSKQFAVLRHLTSSRDCTSKQNPGLTYATFLSLFSILKHSTSSQRFLIRGFHLPSGSLHGPFSDGKLRPKTVKGQGSERLVTSNMEVGASSQTNMINDEDMIARSQLRDIFLTAVNSGMPRQMLEKIMKFDKDSCILRVEDRIYNINRNVFVVGFGKAVLGMARVVEEVLGDHIIKGILSLPTGARADLVKAGRSDTLLKEGSKICIKEGATNNLPDETAFGTARDIYRLISNLTSKDLVIVLMSGGGSALLPYPVEPLTLEDVLNTTRELFAHGASILEVNTVRKHLEVLKGGGLAREAMPAQVLSFIISDVIGDSLDVIASGPTVRQMYSPHRCLDIISRLGAWDSIPTRVLETLETKKNQMAALASYSSSQRETSYGKMQALPDKTDWSRVHNVLVGTNAIACQSAALHAEELGFVSYILSTELSGEAKEVGVLFAKLAEYISACLSPKWKVTPNKDLVLLEMEIARLGVSKTNLNEVADKAAKASNHSKPLCVVAGGETVVTIRGCGKGGRNQEMVLAAGIQLQQSFRVWEHRPQADVFFFSAGTDGQDGPTEAAGAIVDENFMLDAESQRLNPQLFLHNNDSFSLWSQFCQARDLIVTGLTGTNVMDIQLLLVKGQLHPHFS